MIQIGRGIWRQTPANLWLSLSARPLYVNMSLVALGYRISISCFFKYEFFKKGGGELERSNLPLTEPIIKNIKLDEYSSIPHAYKEPYHSSFWMSLLDQMQSLEYNASPDLLYTHTRFYFFYNSDIRSFSSFWRNHQKDISCLP